MKRRRANQQGTIGQRENGTFYGAVRLNGKRRWVYGSTEEEVASQLEALREAETAPEPGEQPLEVYLRGWLSEVVRHRNKPRTYSSYRLVVEEHINPVLGSVPLNELRPQQVQSFINGLTEKGLAPNTIRNVRAVLRRALNQALRWGLLTSNPAVPVDLPRIERFEAQPLTKEEAQRFLTTIKGHRLEALYLIAILLGPRQGEILGLYIEDVDLEAGTLRIRAALQYQDGKRVRVTPKTKSSQRTVPLPPSLVGLLREHIARQRKEFPDSPYLFTTILGTPVSCYTLLRQFKALLKRSKITRNVRFHDLRHTCATFLLMRGENPRTVAELLGHSQVSTTLNIYAHAPSEQKASAVSDLEADLLG